MSGPRIQIVVNVELSEDALASEVESLRRFVERSVGRLEMAVSAKSTIALRRRVTSARRGH